MSLSRGRHILSNSPDPRSSFLLQDPKIRQIIAESKKLCFVHKDIINRSIAPRACLHSFSKLPSVRKPEPDDRAEVDLLVNYHPVQLQSKRSIKRPFNKNSSESPVGLVPIRHPARKSLNSLMIENAFKRKSPVEHAPDLRRSEFSNKSKHRYPYKTRLKIICEKRRSL